METVSRVGHSEPGVTAVDRIAGEARVITKIFSAGSAIRAIPISPAKPRNSDAISDCECGSGLSAATVGALRSFRHFAADFFNSPDDLMPEYQRQLRIRQFAVY